MHSLGIDVGGTGIQSALVDTSTGLLWGDRLRLSIANPADPQSILSMVHELGVSAQRKAPYRIAFSRTRLNALCRTATNIDARCIDFPIVEFFEERLGPKIFFAHDAGLTGSALWVEENMPSLL